MHYLEDDLELLEGVPEELKQQCFEMRDLDGRVEKSLADVREESREFFNIINQLNPEERERRCAKIRETYKVIREMSEEKLAIAEYLHLMLEKYQERIAKDLTEFKYELEADTAGVTDGIEKELGESIKTASASRRTVRPVLGNQLATVAEHDSNLEDIKPPGGLSNTQSSSTNMYRMNGHRHPSSSSETHSQSDERRPGEEFVASSQHDPSTSAARQLAVRRPVTGGSSRASLDETSSKPEFFPPKRKVPRPIASPMAFNPPQQQVLDTFGIRKTSHPSQRYSPAPITVSSAGSASLNASRQPLRFNYPNTATLSGAIIGGRSGGGGHGGNRPLVGQPSNEIAQKIDPSSSSSSESTYQQPHSIPSAQPAFAGQAESQSSYGRPVKLTSRVQQMLKDRQIQGHRGHVGRPSGLVYSASTSSSSSYSNNSNYGQSARFGSAQHANNMGELSEEESRQVYSQDQQYLDEEADEEDVEALGEEDEEADEDSEDQDSRVWCTCQQKSEGDMVACDNKSCPYEWFHYSCVGIAAPPKGKWFCPTCVKKMRRSQSTENH